MEIQKNQLTTTPEFIHFDSKEENLHFEGVFDIEPRELHEKLKVAQDKMILIDVRQPEEYQGDLGHIPASQLIALDMLSERIQEIPKNKTIIFICRSGNRSARAASFALDMGYQDVYNLKGGMILWNELSYYTEGNN